MTLKILQGTKEMTKTNLNQIFSAYIQKFDYITYGENHENYKWSVATEFKKLMDEALSKNEKEFAEALNKVKICTKNIIDSYTQPFGGLVELAKKKPEEVKEMFLDLYTDDGGDLKVQAQLISNFLKRSEELLDIYFPGSFRYKQNSHSVSAYLFLYAPETHYMYKAQQSNIFADCIEFYDDWGSGDNIKLDVYYRMCDWVVEQIMQNEDLLKADATRFSESGEKNMIEDTNKHMLLFDIIYACSVYDLFDGITFTRPKAREKAQIIERREKAVILLEKHNSAVAEYEKLLTIIDDFEKLLVPGETLAHRQYGKGNIVSYINDILEVSFDKFTDIKRLGATTSFVGGLLKFDSENNQQKFIDLLPYIKQKSKLKKALENSEKELKSYKEYLE